MINLLDVVAEKLWILRKRCHIATADHVTKSGELAKLSQYRLIIYRWKGLGLLFTMIILMLTSGQRPWPSSWITLNLNETLSQTPRVTIQMKGLGLHITTIILVLTSGQAYWPNSRTNTKVAADPPYDHSLESSRRGLRDYDGVDDHWSTWVT